MKKVCFLLAMIFSLSFLASSCAGNPVETSEESEQTVDSTTETPVIPPAADPWRTAVWSKEPWWENFVMLRESVKAASQGTLVLSGDIQQQDDDTLLAVEAIIFRDGCTIKENYDFFASYGFEMISYPNYGYTEFCVFLATKKQLLSLSFPEECKIGFKLAFAAEGFYNEIDQGTQADYAREFFEGEKEIYGTLITIKIKPDVPYSPADMVADVLDKHPIPIPPNGLPDNKISFELDLTPEQLLAILTSDGFFEDCTIFFRKGTLQAVPT